MVVFTDVQAGVESALDACREVSKIHAKGYDPSLRAGLHLGRPRQIGGDDLGVDVNVAARVAEAAKGSEVLVSQTACDHLDPDAFELKKLRRFKAKGAPGDLAVYSVSPASG
jgi:adenylate cyclase